MSRRTRIAAGTPCAMLAVMLALGSGACAAPDGRDTEARRAGPAHSHDVDAADVVPKPRAPISIAHEWLAPPAVGEELALRLEISSEQRLADVLIELTGGVDLVVDAGSAAKRVAGIPAGTTHVLEPTVLAAAPGRHYLAVSVSADIDGARQTRSVAIPVRLGDPVEAPSADDAKAGERVRSLPVEERTGRR